MSPRVPRAACGVPGVGSRTRRRAPGLEHVSFSSESRVWPPEGPVTHPLHSGIGGPSVVVLGGGLAGAAAAYTLALAGCRDITVIERGPRLGGLAGNFEIDGRTYPLGYHHILHRDRTLLSFLDRIGALSEVRWRRIRMGFVLNRTVYELGRPAGFLRFPMRIGDKLRFLRLMLRAFATTEWNDWCGRSAAELVDSWSGLGVRRALFDPLMYLKFDMPCADISAAWLGARLSFREGSAPLGYIPNTNWTTRLCDGLARLLEDLGVKIRLRTGALRIDTSGDRVTGVQLDTGERLAPEVLVSALPTEVYARMIAGDGGDDIAPIRYSALISVVAAIPEPLDHGFYWLNFLWPRYTAGGLFVLSALNPTIGHPGETCVNFVTHLKSRHDPLFTVSDSELLSRYREDFQDLFGSVPKFVWSSINRIPLYSPVYVAGYRNPPIQSRRWRNLYFAGNYRTFPSVSSTGTAMWSGLEAGAAVLRSHGRDTKLLDEVAAFRLRSMPKSAPAPGRARSTVTSRRDFDPVQ